MIFYFGKEIEYADLAHLVERHLAKVEVASSSLVIRSSKKGCAKSVSFFSLTKFISICIIKLNNIKIWRK
jgi:hypothetical protein